MLAPGDKIADQLVIEGVSLHTSRDNYLAAYRDIQVRYNQDKAPFYFAILPSYFPDTLHRIIPKQKRILITNILRQTKSWDKAEEFYEQHLQARQYLESHSDDAKSLLAVVNKIAVAKDLGGVKALGYELSAALEDAQIKNQGLISDLISSIEVLETSRGWSWPTLRWFGISNQFQSWMSRLFSSNNRSVLDGESVMKKIRRALSWTVSLGLITYLIVGIFSLMVSYAQVYYKGSWMDRIVSGLTYFLIAVPSFWMATLMVVFFTTPEYGAWTDIFPSVGIKPSFVEQSFLNELITNIGQLILPILILSIMSIAYLSLQTKNDLLRVGSLPFVTAARARGLSTSQNLARHILPNGLMTYLTLMTGSIPSIFGGSLIIEVIFNIPGIGRLMLYSIREQDWPVVFTIVIILSFITITSYILGDLLMAKLYPKTRESFAHE